MTYMVVYSSITGNTQMIAEAIKDALGEDGCLYHGKVGEILTQDADIVFAGFWVNKGSCAEEMKKYLKALENKKIALFGTAGFGGAESYYETVLAEIKQCISKSNIIIDSFMCQGKMPHPILERYQKLHADQPENSNISGMIDNYENAASHPDAKDVEAAKVFAKRIFFMVSLRHENVL